MKYALTYWTVVEADSPEDAVREGQEKLSKYGHEFEPDTIEPLQIESRDA